MTYSNNNSTNNTELFSNTTSSITSRSDSWHSSPSVESRDKNVNQLDGPEENENPDKKASDKKGGIKHILMRYVPENGIGYRLRKTHWKLLYSYKRRAK
jgi:hypothetical protein